MSANACACIYMRLPRMLYLLPHARPACPHWDRKPTNSDFQIPVNKEDNNTSDGIRPDQLVEPVWIKIQDTIKFLKSVKSPSLFPKQWETVKLIHNC